MEGQQANKTDPRAGDKLEEMENQEANYTKAGVITTNNVFLTPSAALRPIQVFWLFQTSGCVAFLLFSPDPI